MGSPRRPVSLNSLVTFECAARLASFSTAAEELNLTRSAVSHQIGRLERTFGVRLFERKTNGVELTAAGARFYEKISTSLTEITDVTGEFFEKPRRQRLTVQSAPTFASRWLVERLGAFLAQFPNIDFQLIASSEQPDFKDPELDLAICYGEREWPGCSKSLLITERVEPLCSPALVENAGIRSVDDLTRVTLIRTDLNVISWETWLREQNLDPIHAARQIRLNPSFLALEAAVRGLGVVLESDILARKEIESNLLVAPFDKTFATHNAYFLVRPSDDRRRYSSDFCKWLIEEADAFARAGADLSART